MMQRKHLKLSVPILESTLATSHGLEDAGSYSLFQKAKKIITLQITWFHI